MQDSALLQTHRNGHLLSLEKGVCPHGPVVCVGEDGATGSCLMRTHTALAPDEHVTSSGLGDPKHLPVCFILQDPGHSCGGDGSPGRSLGTDLSRSPKLRGCVQRSALFKFLMLDHICNFVDGYLILKIYTYAQSQWLSG